MSDSDSNEQEPTPTLASSRSRRDNAGKRKGGAGKFAALQKLKEARSSGRKMNYEVEDVENVYDVVEESEYADKVNARRGDDWIVDDDGGYVEDGREIFDEEDNDDVGSSSKTKTKDKKIKEKKEGSKGSNIKNMLLAMPGKKAGEKDVKLEDDLVLGDILGQIKSKGTPGSNTGTKKTLIRPSNTTEPSQSERNPFIKKGTGLKKVVTVPKPTPTVGDTEVEVPETTTDTQNIEQFDSENMEGFDDEMDIQEFDDIPAEKVEETIPEKTQVEENNRGFAAPLESKSQSGDWMFTGSNSSETSSLPTIEVDRSTLPTINLQDGSQAVRMYWLDAHEDPYKHPGTVWMFGKVWVESAKSFVSCCLTVKNIPRRIYLAKKDDATAMDLYNEFNDKIAKRYKIMEHKCRPVEKQYAFEHTDISDNGTYLEVIYSSQYPALPADLKGESFSRVFGTPQTSLEWFLLEQKIKGPGWLDIKSATPSSPPVSWCKLEAMVPDPNMVSVSPCTDEVPPLTVLSIKLGTVINPKSQQNEVAMVGCLAHTNFLLSVQNKETYTQHFCLLTKPVDEAWPFDWTKAGSTANQITKVEKAVTERELLSLLLTKIQKLDPDVIIGHDVASFDLEVMVHRMAVNKIPNWSRLGRLRRSNQPGNQKYLEKQAMIGRLVADLKISSKELIRCKSYELGALVEKCLKEGDDESRMKLTPDALRKSYENSEHLKMAIQLCMRDADQTLRIMVQLQALPLALQISQIVGTVLSKTLRGGRAERIEYLLLHAFTGLGFIVPDKQYGKRRANEEEEGDTEQQPKGRNKKPTYAGGLVLDPKKGFYDKFILLLDFNSLYPSIIQEYNICFTTVERTKLQKTEDGDMILPSVPDPSLAPGVLPKQIKKLVESRREVKNILKTDKSLTEAQKAQLNIRQLGLKLTANSMYGCLGFSFSRFFAKQLAALVTSKGREILLQTRDLIQKMNLDVIYGDTDSVMVNTNSNDYEEVFRLGREIKTTVNKLYKLLELDIDGVYKYMLLLKKKKYAAVTVEKDSSGKLLETMELKGLDIVRRDWSQLAADAGKNVISIIMSDKSEDDRLSEIQEHLEGLKVSLLDGKVALKDLAITKSLTKDPSDYPDKKSLPHVQVALRVNSSGGKKLRSGDTVEYVICDDGSGLSATQRAYHVDEVKSREDLKIDTNYYLAQQLHPVISRLCDPIEGMEGARVAASLGLDPDQYRSRVVTSATEDQEGVTRDEDRFRYVEKLVLDCVCGTQLTVDSPTVGGGKDEMPALVRCPAAKECGGFPLRKEGQVVNRIDLLVRKCLNKYYAGWLVCEDPGCTGRTRALPLQFQRAYPVCSSCGRASMCPEYTDTALYTQLQYLVHILDYKKMSQSVESQDVFRSRMFRDEFKGVIEYYEYLKDRMEKRFMKYNGYGTVSLCKIFEGLFPTNTCSSSQQGCDLTPAQA